MRTPKPFSLVLALLCLCFTCFSQEKSTIKFGKVKPEDFDLRSPLIDSGTNAVIVADIGNSTFVTNTSDVSFSLIFKEKKRIKIINKNGFDAATIIIPLYVSDKGKEEKLDDLDAYTYNVENGKVIETKLPKSAVFTEQHSRNWIYKKFTFPALKEGSIIEYSVKITSDFFSNLQPWTFQGPYPVLWSQYEAAIPDFFKYATLAQGYQPFYINDVKSSRADFSFVEHTDANQTSEIKRTSSKNSFSIEGIIDYHNWVMKDVPALKEEAYTTTIDNSVAKIEFQLSQVAYPNQVARNYMNSWENAAGQLMEDPDFGQAITRPNNWLDNEVENILKGATTQREKALKIFEYVRDHFSTNNTYGIYLHSNLKDVLKNKNGSVAEINLLLIAMLKNQHITANPVILSTRENGFTHEYYPLLNRYNYVIAKAEVDGNEFFLDAAIPQLAFGSLPAKIYNGQAREITKDMANAIYFIADSLKESTNSFAFITNRSTGTVEGSFNKSFGMFQSLNVRNTLKKSVLSDFKTSIQNDYPEGIELNNVEVNALDVLEDPVKVKYDLRLKSFGEADIVYFNPLLGEGISKNPFAAAERFYPVEMPYSFNNTYRLTMEIPKGYKVDELPKSVRFKFNEDEGMFEYLISVGNDMITLTRRLYLTKATFTNEDYQYLRDFYAFVVKKDAEQIVFKKIK